MTVPTVGLAVCPVATLGDLVGGVLCGCSEEQMGQVTARRVVAAVQDVEAIRDWAVGQHPSNAVSALALAFPPHAAVSAGELALHPHKTPVDPFEAIEETCRHGGAYYDRYYDQVCILGRIALSHSRRYDQDMTQAANERAL